VGAYACVIEALQAEGYCAGRYDDDRSGAYSGSDALCVRAPGAEEWVEWKLVNFGGSIGHHASSLEHTGAFRLTSPPVVEPPVVVEPPPVTCPPVTRIDVVVRPQARIVLDATPKTTGREVCDSLGFVNRAECPLGQEGSGSRELCEAHAGPYAWTLPEGCYQHDTNPLMGYCPMSAVGAVLVCAANGVCGSVALP
jgi:hypothetical protein